MLCAEKNKTNYKKVYIYILGSGCQLDTLMYVIPHWGDVGSPFPSPAKKQEYTIFTRSNNNFVEETTYSCYMYFEFFGARQRKIDIKEEFAHACFATSQLLPQSLLRGLPILHEREPNSEDETITS